MARILIIDDELSIRKLLRHALEQVDHTVEEAENGMEVAVLFCRHPADLVVTDIFMPEKDGFETIRELQRDFPGVKIIAISGGDVVMGQETALKIALPLGAIRVMKKPFGAEEFVAAVQKTLAQ